MSLKSILLAACVGSVILAEGAQGQSLPANRTVVYDAHSTPADANTPLAWTVRVSLAAQSVSGSIVTWRIQSVRINDVALSREWLDTIPAGALSDWSVQHADPQAPADGEFWGLPHISRTAGSLGISYTALAYDVAGASSPPPPGAALALSWVFWRQGATAPDSSDTDRPILIRQLLDT